MRLPTNKTLLASIAVLASTSVGAFAFCSEDVVHLRGDWGKARFSVEIADDNKERAVGLMNRESMASSSGMLFVYPKPGNLSFWMRNTLIPLDMLFIDPQGKIAHIHENAIPLDETPIHGGAGLIAVLEINGGLSRKLGITVGSQIAHPAFDPETALWSCKTGG